MYPKNAASPEPIGIGPVVQIADGAVQTSGVTVRIKPIGVAEADGAGTTAYSTDGVVLYTPTQAETNYTSFVLVAKKTGCIPSNITIVTTESVTPGRVSLGNILGTAVTEATPGNLAGTFSAWNDTNPTTCGTAASVPRALPNTTTGMTTGDVLGWLTTNVGLLGAALSAIPKTGFKLASDGLAAVVSWTVAITGNITGNLSGSVGSVTGGATAANQTTINNNVLLTATQVSVDAVKVDTAAIKLKTDNLPSDPADQSAVEAAITAATSPLATAVAVAAIAADLPTRITKNTALAAFPFQMVLAADHSTAATGITITATRSLDGGAFAACANSATEISSGFYKINLDATDLNANTVILRFTGTGCDDTCITIVTEPT